MDDIKITIEHESQDEGATFIHVYINGNALPKILNIEAFFALKQSQGLVPLFTCGCGDFDCGGYYVDVSCTDTALTLRNSYHRFNRSLQSTFEYTLDWQQVSDVAQEIITYLEKLQQHNPQAYVTMAYGGGNHLDRLPDYRRSPILMP